jgi:hypothetical protein
MPNLGSCPRAIILVNEGECQADNLRFLFAGGTLTGLLQELERI